MNVTPMGVSGLKPTQLTSPVSFAPTPTTNNNEFIVPPVENQGQMVPPEKASETAFYAAATSSPDPIADYTTAKADIELTGQSDFVNMAQTAWKNEQDSSMKGVVESIISDPSIPSEQKKTILSTYALTGYVEPNLKEKYIQQTAAKQVGPTLDDQEAQDIVVNTLAQRRAANQKQVDVNDTTNLIKDKVGELKSLLSTNKSDDITLANVGNAFKDAPETAMLVVSDIVNGLAGGVAKLATMLDPTKTAADAIAKQKQVVDKLTIAASNKDIQKTRDALFQFLEPLGAFNKKIYNDTKQYHKEKGTDPKLAELDAMASSIIEDPLSWIGVGAISHQLPEKPLLEVAPESPAAVTHIANPQVAEKAGAGAIVEPTGHLAEALGTDRGTLIHDWVLSKPIPDKEQVMRPDLVEELRKMDAEARTTFQDYRYDPSLMEASKREEETTRVFNVIKENRSPYYQQSNSTIIETPTTFEGKAVYGRNGSSGYLKEDAAIAARDRLQESLDQLPEDVRGTLSIVKQGSEYLVEHRWQKKYDDLSAHTFGPDSIQTSMLGIDASGLARSGIGKWIFPTGWLPKWAEQGAGRNISRGAVIENNFIRQYRDKISASPYGPELTHLIGDAERVGKDYYSPAEMSSMFPHLSTKQVDDLFSTHTMWRRLQEYNYNFFNRIERNQLVSKGMKGLYDKDGNFIGPATDAVSPMEKDSIKSVWNFDSDNILDYTDQLKIRQDKTLVRLHEPIRVGDEVLNYGLMGTEHKLDLLPTETLPRIPGYSPRRVKENFFVDATPKNLTVDGIKIKDPLKLRNYSRTVAAARNEREAQALVREMQDQYPDHTVTSRPERTDNYGQLVTDYKVYNEQFRHSMKRGEPLPSRNGPARIEDRLLTAINTTKLLSRLESFNTWDQTFQKAFTKAYGKFLPEHTFPTFKTDIKPLENMDKVLKKEYDTAHRLYEYYANQKNFQTLGDYLWKKSLYNVADVLEKFRIPSGLIRELGKKQNPMTVAKTVGTSLFIHLAPLRQWIIQPAQMAELMAINPTTGMKNLPMVANIMMELGTDAKVVQTYSKILKFGTGLFTKTAEKMGLIDKGEFSDIMKGIKQAGIIQSIDMNSVIHGVFRDVDRGFTETSWEAGWARAKQAVGFLPKLGRSVGFDPAEISNQIGTWLQVKDMWIAKNPGKAWNTKEAFEEIAHETWRYAGNMTRAGNLPYQQGALSLVFQFAAIQQKLMMNILQDNATILSPLQRARLGALRLGLYGVKYGIPGGALVYAYIDNQQDPQLKEVMNDPIIRRGFIDIATNGVIASIVEPDAKPDLAVSRMFSPYSEDFLPYLDVLHSTFMMLDNDPVSKPRYPVLSVMSSFGNAIQDMQGWWTTKDVTPDTFKMMAMEAAELGSGMNSWAQGQLMLGMQDKVSRMGNQYDLQTTKAEAYAKMFFGVPTQKEEDLWNIVKNERDHKQQIKDMATQIHTQLMNQRTKIGEDDYEIYGKRLNSFISLLDPKYFNDMDKIAVMDQIVKLDRNSFTKTRQSVFASVWARYSEQMTQDRTMTMDILKRSDLPQAKELADKLEKGEL